MDIHADQPRCGVRQEFRASLLDHLAARGVPDLGIPALDVAAGQKPAIQPSMMHEQQTLTVRRENQAAAGDMAGSEVGARKRVGRAIEEQKDQLLTFQGLAVSGIVERTDGGLNQGGSDHKKQKARSEDRAFYFKPGNFLLSHIVTYAVPSGLRGLTAVFGMGTGGSPSLRSPRRGRSQESEDRSQHPAGKAFILTPDFWLLTPG